MWAACSNACGCARVAAAGAPFLIERIPLDSVVPDGRGHGLGNGSPPPPRLVKRRPAGQSFQNNLAVAAAAAADAAAAAEEEGGE